MAGETPQAMPGQTSQAPISPEAGAAMPVPVSGVIRAGVHHFPVRVYFEDTDLSGIVYHANYLRYMERARSDLLRVLGIDQRAAFDAGLGVYAVADLAIRYVAPARLEDDLRVETSCQAVGGVTVTMAQQILRGEDLLTQATLRAAFLTRSGRPQRQPSEWLGRFRALIAA